MLYLEIIINLLFWTSKYLSMTVWLLNFNHESRVGTFE